MMLAPPVVVPSFLVYPNLAPPVAVLPILVPAVAQPSIPLPSILNPPVRGPLGGVGGGGREGLSIQILAGLDELGALEPHVSFQESRSSHQYISKST